MLFCFQAGKPLLPKRPILRVSENHENIISFILSEYEKENKDNRNIVKLSRKIVIANGKSHMKSYICQN